MTDSTPHPNNGQFLEIAALIEAVKWGKLDLSLELHNNQIKGLSVFGQKRLVFNKTSSDEHDNNDAMVQILKRIKQSIEKVENSELSFSVKVTKGQIKSVTWNTQTSHRY